VKLRRIMPVVKTMTGRMYTRFNCNVISTTALRSGLENATKFFEYSVKFSMELFIYIYVTILCARLKFLAVTVNCFLDVAWLELAPANDLRWVKVCIVS
jgi:hypothetical protein